MALLTSPVFPKKRLSGLALIVSSSVLLPSKGAGREEMHKKKCRFSRAHLTAASLPGLLASLTFLTRPVSRAAAEA